MSNRRLLFTVGIVGAFVLLGVNASQACKYCWAAEAAASQYTQQSMLPQGPGSNPPGAFPLDSTISQFTPASAPAALSTTPPAGSVVTSAADLRVGTVPTAASASVHVASAGQPAHGVGHFADAGLLGLAAVGGVFCWRTRRKPGSEH